MQRGVVVLAFLSATVGARASYHELGHGAPNTADRGPPSYPLDDRPRQLETMPRNLRCDTSEFVTYQGTAIRFTAPVTLHPAFIPYVERFERLVVEVALEHYGRAPRTMKHVGGYNCRTIRGSRGVLSEHALGNAIDIAGFGFYGLGEGETLPENLPRHLRRSFIVRVEDHWSTERLVDAPHREFFAKLRERLEASPDLFQVMLGPSYPGHERHLHFDRSPWPFIQF